RIGRGQFAGIVMGLEEGEGAAAQLRIVAAFPLQHRRSLGRRQFGNRLKDALDALKIDRHVGTPVPTAALTCVNGPASCRKKLAESQNSPRVVGPIEDLLGGGTSPAAFLQGDIPIGRFEKTSYFLCGAAFPWACFSRSATSFHNFCHAGRSASGSLASCFGSRTPPRSVTANQCCKPLATLAAAAAGAFA